MPQVIYRFIAMILCEAGEEYIEYVVDMGTSPSGTRT